MNLDWKPTMMTYIHEEEAMSRSILAAYPDNVEAFAATAWTKADWLVLATGSSINAALSAKSFIERLAGVRIDIREPFHFSNYESFSPYTDLVVGISQSGQSTSTIGALERARQETELTTIAFTSNVNAEISAAADVTIDIGCGQERVGFVTKGFLATVFTLMLAGLRTAAVNGMITQEKEQEILRQFERAIDAIPLTIVKTEQFFDRHQDDFVNAPRFTAIGYGPAYGTIKEFETKFCETVRMPSQGIELEAFMHGPYLEVNPEHRIFFLEIGGRIQERLELLRDYESKYTNYTYTLSLTRPSDERTIGLELELTEEMAPFIMIIPFQILAHHIATAKGIELRNRIYTDFGVAMKSKTKPGDYA
ncbi:sugar isomerase (SIS) [Paenibacillus curdlanolyticus YK9]|uniref:Sugar isomerase (SIS) n=1 Tax=Paenibacillus curdlanolyticus YK9 TaxID=717606 RepID=E0ID56_9BACL|nr:SIS domain-containing protein [Paenibacillus curdlanolyticus]EFM09511.1 sugar isomerase (SIS) [Paenibacillus curdlanolyticus YK9]